MSTDVIYVELLDEGVEVRAPVEAVAKAAASMRCRQPRRKINSGRCRQARGFAASAMATRSSP